MLESKIIEVWKDVEDFAGIYKVSNFGNVKALLKKTNFGIGYKIYPERNVKNWKDKKGYCYVTLSDNGIKKNYLVHRLVAQSFLNNSENKPQVNHIDGIKSNNNLINLEWCTSKENINHAIDNKLINTKGVNNYQSKFSEKQVVDIRNNKLSQDKIAKIYNVSQSIISKIKLFKTYKDVGISKANTN